jgi:hypothetical protein
MVDSNILLRDAHKTMTDAAAKVVAAKQRMIEAAKVVADAEAEERKWREFVAMLSLALQSYIKPLATDDQQPQSDPEGESLKLLSSQETAAVVALVLDRSPCPLQTAEILPELQKLGYTVEGKDPQAVLFTRLTRMPRDFYHTRGEGWRRTALSMDQNARQFVEPEVLDEEDHEEESSTQRTSVELF